MALPPPLAEGDLARTPFAHVLLHVRSRSLDGSLIVWDPDVPEGAPQQDRILFENGSPVAAALLVGASRLDRGLLPLFARDHGPYAFYEGVDLTGSSERVRRGVVRVETLIAASLRGSARQDAVAHVVSAFGDSLLRLTHGFDAEPFNLLPDEAATVTLLRAEPAAVSSLIESSPLTPQQVQRLVYLLAITKSVEVFDPTVKPAPRVSRAPAEDRPARPRSAPSDKPRRRGATSEGPSLPPPPPEHLSDRHRAQWEEIAERAAAIETEDYFIMLGVERDVSSKAIETAYYGLVRKWHPDRIPAELNEMRPFVERIFQYLTRAQETLCDDDKRGPYLATVQSGGGTPEAERELGQIIGAAMEFRKVEVLMRRREWDSALELIDQILDVAPDEADYHATRAHILWSRAPADKSSQAALEISLRRALELQPGHDRAHYTLGLVLKRGGDGRAALEHFTKAAELNPRNIDAAREVRIAEMRSRDSARPKKEARGRKDSFFGKLFGGGKKD